MIFKVRIDPPKPPKDVATFLSMEMWIQAAGIVEAVNYVAAIAKDLGYKPEHVSKVIDITPEQAVKEMTEDGIDDGPVHWLRSSRSSRT